MYLCLRAFVYLRVRVGGWVCVCVWAHGMYKYLEHLGTVTTSWEVGSRVSQLNLGSILPTHGSIASQPPKLPG